MNFPRAYDSNDFELVGNVLKLKSTAGGGTSGGDVAVRGASSAQLPSYVATSTTLTAVAPGQIPVQDGLTWAVNDVVLLKDEPSPLDPNNGLWVVNNSGSPSDLFTFTRLQGVIYRTGLLVSVGAGSTQARRIFFLTTDSAITIGVTPLTFQQVSGGGTISGDVRGTVAASVVAAFQGREFSSAAPADLDAIVWNAGGSTWQPGSAAAGKLKDATGTVDVSASGAPSAAQVLRATDPTHAVWSNNDSLGASGVVATYHGGGNLPSDAIEYIVGSTTLSATKFVHACDSSSAGYTVFLPSAAAIGDVHLIADFTAAGGGGNFGAHNVLVQVQGGGTINGSSSHNLTIAWAGRGFMKISSAAWIAFQ